MLRTSVVWKAAAVDLGPAAVAHFVERERPGA